MRTREGAELSFLYTLANDLGKTVMELQDNMSAEEFNGWVAWYNNRAERQKR